MSQVPRTSALRRLLCLLATGVLVAAPVASARLVNGTILPNRIVGTAAADSVVFPTIVWSNPLPAPQIVGSQFPALLQLDTRRARGVLHRGTRIVRRWNAPVVQGSNLVRLPRAAWRRLRPGRYGLEVVVTNAAGGSAPLRLRFDAVRSTRR